jgi:hypothetical protein
MASWARERCVVFSFRGTTKVKTVGSRCGSKSRAHGSRLALEKAAGRVKRLNERPGSKTGHQPKPSLDLHFMAAYVIFPAPTSGLGPSSKGQSVPAFSAGGALAAD